MRISDFIANMNDLYKPALNHGQMPFYSKFLEAYTDSQLEELWTATMEAHIATSQPSIGKLKEYSKTVTKVRVITIEEAEATRRKNLTHEQIFSTYIGKLSLTQGFSASYYIHCKDKGVPEQDDVVLMQFQKGQHNAVVAQRECEEMLSHAGLLNGAAGLLNFRQSQLERNQQLFEKYGYLVN